MHEGALLFREHPQYIHCPAAEPHFDASAEQLALPWIKAKWAKRYDVALLFHTAPPSTQQGETSQTSLTDLVSAAPSWRQQLHISGRSRETGSASLARLDSRQIAITGQSLPILN